MDGGVWCESLCSIIVGILTQLTEGDVAYAEALGHKIVVLGSYSAIDELLNRRSAVYSSRPTHTMVNKLCVFSRLTSTVSR
jgi:hypothetical protein